MLQGVGIADRIAGYSGIEARHALHGDILNWRPQDALLLLLLLGGWGTGGLGTGAGVAATAAAVGVIRRQGLLGLPQGSTAAG